MSVMTSTNIKATLNTKNIAQVSICCSMGLFKKLDTQFDGSRNNVENFAKSLNVT